MPHGSGAPVSAAQGDPAPSSSLIICKCISVPGLIPGEESLEKPRPEACLPILEALSLSPFSAPSFFPPTELTWLVNGPGLIPAWDPASHSRGGGAGHREKAAPVPGPLGRPMHERTELTGRGSGAGCRGLREWACPLPSNGKAPDGSAGSPPAAPSEAPVLALQLCPGGGGFPGWGAHGLQLPVCADGDLRARATRRARHSRMPNRNLKTKAFGCLTLLGL